MGNRMATNFKPPTPEQIEKIKAGGFAPPTPEQLKAAKEGEPGVIGTGVDYALRGLDYLAGGGRTAVAALGDLLTEKNITSVEDWEKALKGKATPSSEFMKRADIPEGGSLSDVLPGIYNESGAGLKLQKGGWADPTARGAAGFALDTLSDPLTYATGGGNFVGKRLLRPLATTAEKTAYPIFKQGLARVDASVVGKLAKGVPLPSKVLFDEGIWGRLGTIKKKTGEFVKRLGEQRANLYDKMPLIDPRHVDYKEVADVAEPYLAHSFTKNAAEKATQSVAENATRAPMSGRAMSTSKSILDDIAERGGAFTAGKEASVEAKIAKAAANAERKALENAAESAIVGGGQQLIDLNTKLSSLLAGRKPIDNLSAIEIRKMRGIPTVVDVGGAAAMNAAKGGEEAVKWYLMKKAADTIRMPSVLTGAGIGLKKLGTTNAWDVLARRGLLNNSGE